MLLINNGADVNVAHGDKNRTALHLAAQKGREKIANFLVRHGAKVDIVDTLHRSPLHVAARNGKLPQ